MQPGGLGDTHMFSLSTQTHTHTLTLSLSLSLTHTHTHTHPYSLNGIQNMILPRSLQN